jgi:chorismate mutase
MSRDEASADPVVRQLREQISDTDRALLEAVNTRLKLVARLKDYKASRGYPFVDRDREELMVRYLERVNGGPISREGLHEFFESVLALTKREVAGEREGVS